MRRVSRLLGIAVVSALSSIAIVAQQPSPTIPADSPRYDVVSIKRHAQLEAGSSSQTLPDGTQVMINQTIRSMLGGAAPVPVREVVGYPSWVANERYDITLKPPAGSTREQRAEMHRTMFAERMKLVAHVEEREQTTFAMVLARSDGRLGPELKPAAIDCSPRPPGSPPRPQEAPPDPDKPVDYAARCGGSFGGGTMRGTMTLDNLVVSFSGEAGGFVTNRTGLKGSYTFNLKYSPRGSPPSSDPADPPGFITALQEQLGLKLQPEKTMVPVLVIDSIERPTEN
jgi:uncharacterized protein (TIGR03435 family)